MSVPHPSDVLRSDIEGLGFHPGEDDQTERRRVIVDTEGLMTQDVWLFRECRECSDAGKNHAQKGAHYHQSFLSLSLSIHIQLSLACISYTNDLVCSCMAATGDICNGPQAIVS